MYEFVLLLLLLLNTFYLCFSVGCNTTAYNEKLLEMLLLLFELFCAFMLIKFDVTFETGSLYQFVHLPCLARFTT